MVSSTSRSPRRDAKHIGAERLSDAPERRDFSCKRGTGVAPDLSRFEELARGEGKRLGAERLLDAQRLVPFRHALGAREAADLELRHTPAHRKMDDGDVFAFSRAR